ncbi:hypothetical protein R3W88_016944 [Solanum pinnatisectum]|uniref:Oberon-like PHD finger domain-containing protein n=1 Tax=Solanum pinnatisectum TaxID=50273 RepID=A0AAV9KZ67_9SOLN|nr:hypothetical protein R3W88_016944 [Solanum pinnatisectum]
MQPLLSDSPFGAITCKAGNRICSSLTAENPLKGTRFCDLCCSEPGFCGDCCCILCSKLITLDYDGYSYIRCEATVVDGHICGHVSHLECALRAYMAGSVGGSINLDAEYLCRYCDSRTDLVPHALKLLNICTFVASYADIEKILNVGICILRGSQKSSAKELLHHIESINAKLMKGVSIQDAFKKESCVDSTVTHGYALIVCILFKIVRSSGDMMSRTRIQNPKPEIDIVVSVLVILLVRLDVQPYFLLMIVYMLCLSYFWNPGSVLNLLLLSNLVLTLVPRKIKISIRSNKYTVECAS